MRCIATLAACLLAAGASAADGLDVIPAPASVERHEGAFLLSAATPIVVSSSQEAPGLVAPILVDYVERTNGLKLAIRAGEPRDRAINLRIIQTLVAAPEAYRVEVTRERVTLSASTREGLVHAATTLWQMIPAVRQPRLAIPAAVIGDAPRFTWRGMMLDSARHFQSPAFIKRFIDQLALLKLNTLHWHLTDDQGWRI